MAGEVTSKAIYHSPTSAAVRNHPRHSSSRKSFTTTVPASPFGTPRTLCPRDVHAFSYKPRHLNQWMIPEDVWNHLPGELQASVATLQHAGAAVLTGYERLQQHDQGRDNEPKTAIVDDELEAHLEETILPMPTMPLKLRTFNSDDSKLEESIYTAVFESLQSSGSPGPSPPLSLSQTLSPASPVSPMCLTPSDDALAISSKRPRDRSFSTPLEPHNAYYAAELAHLRTEAIPHLRHAARKVDTDWYEYKRHPGIRAGDVPAFGEWLAEKKDIVHDLDERCKRLTIALGMGPLGWTAP